MARSRATSDGASQRELKIIALIGSRRDMLWQSTDEAGGDAGVPTEADR